MSAVEKQENIASSNKNDDNNTVPGTTCDNSSKSSGDAPVKVKDTLVSIVPTAIEELITAGDVTAPKSTSHDKIIIDKSNVVTAQDNDKSVSELGSLICPPSISSGEICDEFSDQDKIFDKDAVINDNVQKDNLPITDVESLTCGSIIQEHKFDRENLSELGGCNEITDISGHKESVIDDVSDSDIDLKWSDDDDDQTEFDGQPLSDKALELLDKELGIIDEDKETEKTDDKVEKVVQDIGTIEQNSKVLETPIESAESIKSVTVKTEPVGIAADEKTIDKAVKELQQLIDQDNGASKSVEDSRIIYNMHDIQSTDGDDPSEIEMKPTITKINIISLEIELKEEPTIKQDNFEDITKLISVPSGDSKISENSNNPTDTNENTENVPKETNIKSEYESKNLNNSNDNSMDRNDDTVKNVLEIQSKNEITISEVSKDCNDLYITQEHENTEIVPKMQMEKTHASGDDSTISKESNDHSMDVSDNIENMSKILTEKIDIIGDDGTISKDLNDHDINISENTSKIMTEKIIDTTSGDVIPKESNDHNLDGGDNAVNMPKLLTGNDDIKMDNTKKISKLLTKKDEESGDYSTIPKESNDNIMDGNENPENTPKMLTDTINITSKDDILKESNDHIMDGKENTEIMPQILTENVDITQGDDVLKKPNDHIIDGNEITETISKILTGQFDVSGDDYSISKESNDHVIKDVSDNTANVSKAQTKNVDASGHDSTISKESNDHNKDGNDNAKLLTENVDITNEVDTKITLKTIDYTIDEKDSVENASKLDNVSIKIDDVDEFITPDVTNDSVRINTDHRINRPDVMLHIPTQEFDFDDDLNETSEISEKQTPSHKMDKDDSNLTAKTVTEIVNQLAKDKDAETNIEIKDTTDLSKTSGLLDSKTTEKVITQEKTPEKNKVEDTVKALVKKIAESTEKVFEDEVSKKDITDDKTTATQNADEKDPKAIEDATKSKDVDVQPSTSDITKLIPDNGDEVQEVTDSLGLLAESKRVVDEEDDEEQEAEEDDGDDADADDDDDDDFDPDDEESSNQTAEHSEESNAAHSEVDIQEERIDIVYNNDVIGLVSDSNDAEDRFNALLSDSADITVEENFPASLTTDAIELTESVDDAENQQKTDSKVVEVTAEETNTSDIGKPITERRQSILADLLSKPDDEDEAVPADGATKSLDKLKKLDLCKRNNVLVNIVDLGESSSEEDIQVNKESIQVASSADSTKQDSVDAVKGASVISATTDDKASKENKDVKEKQKMGEVFNLDSDEDDKADKKCFSGIFRKNNQCINHNCLSDESVPYYLADRATIAYYGAARRKRRAVCQNCFNVVATRNTGLLSGIKDLRPLMSLKMARPTHQLLEISDSDSEGEGDPVGEGGAKILEEQLAELINESWSKYKMDERLKITEDYLEAELEKMQKKGQEIDELLKNCQKATDKLRVEFYNEFESPRKELPALSLYDTDIASYSCLESEEVLNKTSQMPMRMPKRRLSCASEVPAKKPAIPMGYPETDNKKVTRSSSASALATEQIKVDEDKDLTVVRLTTESAPADLPPPGELTRPPLRVGAPVYAMKNQYGAWLRGRVLEVMPKGEGQQFTPCRIRFEHKVKSQCKMLTARSIAYTEPSEVRMTIGTRVIALFQNADPTNKRDAFYYSGVIAEVPNPVNSYRYLIFFDDGYVQYVHHNHTRLVYESSALVWEEVHPFSRDFVCNYLMKFPERPMVRMHQGQSLTVEWNGKWWETKVLCVDAALVKVHFPNSRIEWIYRGSTRLQPLFAEFQAATTGNRARLPRSTKPNIKTNMPYVEYTRSDDPANKNTEQSQFQSEELRRQRAVAKKSTTLPPQPTSFATDGVVSRVVFYTPKNSVRPYKMIPHNCGPNCRRSDLLSLQELRTYNPLTKPLLSGWERQIVKHKHLRVVMYRAPCGRRVRSMPELHRYLRLTRSDMPVDLFDFNANTHCLAEFVLNKSNVQKKDLSHGKENVPVPCVNYYDHSLPEFCSYNTERTPTAGVPLNLDPDFLCGCDCEDDCVDKTKCACWKMTLEGARTIGIESPNIGYEYRRLPEPLPSGIYECNSRCKCKSTCLNRVVQNPLQLKLQVFKTLNRGWGIRALNDVPKGSFLCIYAGNLLTDATANLDGLNEGDEYLAELDYIEVVESMKEGYEEDIPAADKKLDKKETKKSESEPESESTESEEDERRDKDDIMDDDFQPGYVTFGPTDFNKRLRRRDKKKNKEEQETKEKEPPVEEKPAASKDDDEECITISDDEEVRESQREPSRFTAQENMSANKVVPKYRSIRTYFGKDEACYIMDAKVQGNIGRYLNHSCSPNVFVQNVFVDTHDPRFPWVSFFALHHIRAGTELTWNYNYDIGSVPGKVLYCFCGAPNCRGRLL